MGKSVVTSIRIDEDVLREAKALGLNVSKVAENALKEALRRLKGENCKNNPLS
jgi:post-segregation antitoxin (ccd killing protein)